MPNLTPNYNLIKPLESENYDVNVFNANADTVDAQLAEKVQNFKIKNELVNGDFSQGTVTWTPVNSTFTLTSEVPTIKGNGVSFAPRIDKYNAFECNANDKVFIYSKLRSKNLAVTTLKNATFDGIETLNAGMIENPIVDKWYDVYDKVTIANGTQILLRIQALLSAATSNAVIEIDRKAGVLVVNMTKLGIEDFTKSEMLKIVRTIGYFEGEYGLTQEEAFKITLSLMRENRNAIISLGGTII